VKSRNLSASSSHDMVRVNWLLDSLSSDNRLLYLPQYVCSLTPQTSALLSRICDPFGDLFTEDATAESLRMALAHSQSVPHTQLTIQQMPGDLATILESLPS
jgi:hypothetical protein